MPQDYIVRMIQQMAAMLAGIIAQRQRGELSSAADSIEQKCLEHVGLPLSVVKHTSPEGLAELLATGGDLRYIRSIALAELLIQDAEISVLRGSPFTAVASYTHAVRLLSDSIPVLDREEQRHYRGKLEDVATRLQDLGIDPMQDSRSSGEAERGSGVDLSGEADNRTHS